MKHETKTAIIEVLKSFARFMYFGALALVSTFLVSLTTNADLLNSMWTVPYLNVTLPVGAYIVLAIGVAVKGLDRYINQNKSINSNGIAPNFLQK